MKISYNENVKILEEKTLDNGKNFHALWLAGLTSWRWLLPKVIYRIYSIPFKILMTFFRQLDKKKSISRMELQRSWITREIRRTKEYSCRYPNTCPKVCQWAIMPKSRWHWHKKEKCTNGYLISDKGTKTCKEKTENLFKMVLA